jgi:predicted RNase H-like HicB family nuclease
VPDVPGAFSAGDTIDEAIINSEEAILMLLEDYLERGEALPQPSTIEALLDEKKFKGWAWAFAEVDLAKLSGKTVRISITLPERLLASIDTFALEKGETRSGFLARAAVEAMAG